MKPGGMDGDIVDIDIESGMNRDSTYELQQLAIRNSIHNNNNKNKNKNNKTTKNHSQQSMSHHRNNNSSSSSLLSRLPYSWRDGFRRFALLCARSGRQWLRDPSLLAAQLLLVLLIAAFIGGFANGLARDFPGSLTRVFLFNFMVLLFSLLGMSSIGTLVQERHVFARERASGFYSTGTYAVAKILVCDLLPLRVLPPLVFGSLVYNLINLSDEAGALANFLLVLVLVNVAASAICMLLSAVCRDVSTANLFAAAFFLYSYMFSGLFMAGSTGHSANVKYTSILFYAWEALFANEFRAGSTFDFNPAGVDLLKDSSIELTGSVLLDNFALRDDRLVRDMSVLVGFTIVALLGTFVVLLRSKFRR